MISGLGVDIIEISRIVAAVKNPHFCERVFTETEFMLGKTAPNRLAGFFAAKEALLKALGTGLAGFSWKEMEVAHNEQGAPFFKVAGKVGAFMVKRGIGKIHLSISHCREYAIAQVILETGELE